MLHLTTTKYKLIPSVYGTFKKDHILDHKITFNRFQKAEKLWTISLVIKELN